MYTRLPRIGLVMLVGVGLSLAQTPSSPRPSPAETRTHPEAEAPQNGSIAAPNKPTAASPAEAVHPAEPVQTAPAQSSPVPPQVTFSGGELTISTPNSTLGAVLDAVKAQTGASLEVPPSAAQDRIAAQLGPGPPRDVLAHLLDGSRFDYILLGSPENPAALTQIILTQRAGGPSGPAPVQASMPTPPPEPAAEEPDNEPEAAEPAEQARPVNPPPMPAPIPEQTAPPATSPNAQPGATNQIKTPEQLLQELQRMQQQEQQRRTKQQHPPPQ